MKKSTDIIVASNDRNHLERLRNLIEEKGYSYDLTSSYEDVHKVLEEQAAKLLLCVVDGEDDPIAGLCKKLKSRDPQVSILLLTTLVGSDAVELAKEVGALWCLSEPIDSEHLFTQIELALHRRNMDIENTTRLIRLEKNLNEQNKSLLRVQQEIQNILDAVPASIFFKDKNDKIVRTNKAFQELTGFSDSQLKERTYSELCERRKNEHLEDDNEIIATGNSKGNIIEQIRTAKGTKWLRTYKIPRFDEEGAISGIIGLSLDITDLKEAQRTSIENADKISAITRSVQDAIVMIDNDGEIAFWNDAAEKILGYKREEILGKKLCDYLIPPQYRDQHSKAFEVFRETGKGPLVGKVIEVSAYNSEGNEFPIELSISALKLRGKWHAVGILRDITERKMSEKALRQANKDMEQLISSLPSILIELTSDGIVKRWNKTAQETLGIPENSALGCRLSELPIRWEWEEISKALVDSRDKRTKIEIREVEFARGDGIKRILSLSLTPKIGDGEEISGFIIIGTDITEWRTMENQMLQSQKLQAIGQLAAGIAHEINTPAQYVGDNLRFLKDSFSDLDELSHAYQELTDNLEKEGKRKKELEVINQIKSEIDIEYLEEEIPRALDQSLEGIEHVAKIVKAMKEFSHPGSTEKTPVDLNKALENVMTISKNEWKYVAELVLDLDPNLPPVPCLPGELNQVFLNLVVNAAHAIAEKIGEQPKENQKGEIRISTKKNENWAEIRITDTGNGIPESIQSRIFDPFFTTKEVGKGTGQGLAISYSIVVDKHGGSLTFDTEKGKGTTFLIKLPLEG